jgi:hypothetical protein
VKRNGSEREGEHSGTRIAVRARAAGAAACVMAAAIAIVLSQPNMK